MSTDPRLRLMPHQASSGLGEAVLQRLNQTSIKVCVDPDADGAALVGVAAFVAMLSRLFPQVIVAAARELPTNWWGATSWANLLDRMSAIRPRAELAPTRHINVGVGHVAESCTLYIGGGDWNVSVSRRPVPLEGGNTHALGLHAAACLAISQLLTSELADLGFPGVPASEPIMTNLIDHGLHHVGEQSDGLPAGRSTSQYPFAAPSDGPLQLALAGVGSVGSSALALLCTACSPVLNPGSSLVGRVAVTAIDKDRFDPDRNPFRYPALLGGESTAKATTLSDRLRELGIPADGRVEDVASWNQSREEPGWFGVLVSSVDTVNGRLDVADVLARQTLSAGVDGTALHVQWEGFADGAACPFCDFVRADPPSTQAGVYSQLTGLPIARVLALLQDGAVMEADDVEVAIAAGRLGHRRDALIGAPLSDLVRQAYAEFVVGRDSSGSGRDGVALAAPHVSWFAGALIVAEICKALLGLPLVNRRVDLDVSGLPAGLVRVPPADTTGTCVCNSGVRINWYRRLYDTTARQ